MAVRQCLSMFLYYFYSVEKINKWKGRIPPLKNTYSFFSRSVHICGMYIARRERAFLCVPGKEVMPLKKLILAFLRDPAIDCVKEADISLS